MGVNSEEWKKEERWSSVQDWVDKSKKLAKDKAMWDEALVKIKKELKGDTKLWESFFQSYDLNHDHELNKFELNK